MTMDIIERYYHGKRVFVTGHTGFKGSWFITWLYILGAHVKGYALTTNNQDLYNLISSAFTFESVIADIRNAEKLQAEVINFRPDFIFHFAAQSLVRHSYEVPAETFEINAIGTANVLEAAGKVSNKCTIVVITTDKVYENNETGHFYKESDQLGGFDPYSASKAAAEIVVSSFRNSFFNLKNYRVHQKAIASARAGNVIGGGDWSKDRIIPDIIRSLSAGQPVKVRNPTAVRPWQHILEPLSGYLLLAVLLHENPLPLSGAYNFGPKTDDHLPVRKLVDLAISCWGSGEWVDVSDDTQLHEAGLLQLDISKAKNVLGWKPKLNSKEAIEWTVDWYKQSKEDRLDFTLQQIKNYVQR